MCRLRLREIEGGGHGGWSCFEEVRDVYKASVERPQKTFAWKPKKVVLSLLLEDTGPEYEEQVPLYSY